jgi:hypothetical protein
VSETIVVTAEIRNLMRMLDDLTKLGGPDAGEIIRRRGGLLGRVCAERVQPVTDKETGGQVTESTVKASGTSPATRQMGEKAIFKDLRRAFDVLRGDRIIGPARNLPEKVVLRTKAGKTILVDRAVLAQSQSQMFAHHQSRRLPSNGRTSMAGFRHQTKGRWKSRELLVVPQSWWNSYLREVKGKVGLAKSAFVTAARMIPGAQGLGKLPRWILRHSAPGIGIDRTRGDDPHVILQSRLRYASKVLSQRQVAGIGNAFSKILTKDIRAQIRHLKEKHRA